MKRAITLNGEIGQAYAPVTAIEAHAKRGTMLDAAEALIAFGEAMRAMGITVQQTCEALKAIAPHLETTNTRAK